MSRVVLATALVLGIAAGLAAAFGLRTRMRPVPTADSERPTAIVPSVPKRTRIRLVRGDCPGGLVGFEDQLDGIEAETQRVEAETRGLSSRAASIGTAWPEALNAGLHPDQVAPVIEALLPDDAEVAWSCEEIPCSAMIVLPPEATAAADALRADIDDAFPGSVSGVSPVDDEAYRADRDPHGLALYFQAMPTLEDEAHRQRAYYQARHPRKATREAMRARWIAGD